MLHHFNIDTLDRFLCFLMGNETIFGGKLLVICGDFRQILPVIPGGKRAENCPSMSQSFQAVAICYHIKGGQETFIVH